MMSGFPEIEYRSEEDDRLPLSSDATPLEGLRAVYTNGKIPLPMRLKAMVEAAPYVHPKLAVQVSFEGRDLAALLDRAVERSSKVVEPPEDVEEPKVNSFTGPVPDRRYRR